MAQALAKQLKGRVHIILIGRNKAAADAILASMHPASQETPEAGYEFIACDLTLMAKIRDMTDQLRARVPKVNFLVHCAAIADLSGRVDTEEGLDLKLASRYYSRFALTYGLLAPLQRAADAGEKVSVQTVMGAGFGKGQILMDDLGLKKSYTAIKALREATGYNDLMVAVRHFHHFFFFFEYSVRHRHSRSAILKLRLGTSTPAQSRPPTSSSRIHSPNSPSSFFTLSSGTSSWRQMCAQST